MGFSIRRVACVWRCWNAVALFCVFPASLVVGQVGAPSAELTTAEIAQRTIPATVTLIALGKSGDTLALGSGFLVRPDGLLLTNWHVVRYAYRAAAILSDGRRVEPVWFVAADPQADVAVLKVDGMGYAFVPLASDLPPIGSRIVVVGSPLGLSTTVSEGVVSARRVADDRELVQLTAALSHGSSGGPILNAQGAAFAIATASIEAGQALNFGVPARYAEPLLRSAASARPLSDVTEWRTRAPMGTASTAVGQPPSGATARCRDGTYSFSRTRRGTCSHHGGVAQWLR